MLYDLARTFVFHGAPTSNTFIGTGCFSGNKKKKIDERAAIKFKPDTLGRVSGKMWINHFAVNSLFGTQRHKFDIFGFCPRLTSNSSSLIIHFLRKDHFMNVLFEGVSANRFHTLPELHLHLEGETESRQT